MKKLMFVIGLGFVTGSLWASCVGPFCWDDRGASVGSVLIDGNGAGMPSLTIAQEQAACPRVVGQEIFCSNCAASGGVGTICVSTATTCTAANNFDYVLSTGTKCQ